MRYAALYYLAVALTFTHELDAMTHSEWRLLPLLMTLSESRASAAFVILHVPLFFLVLWAGSHENERLRARSRDVVSILIVAHAGVHFSLAAARAEFSGALSQGLIASSAISGLAYLLVARTRRRQQG